MVLLMHVRLGLAVTAEIGSVSNTTISDLSDLGLSANAIAAAKGGVTGQIFGSGPFNDSGTVGGTAGGVYGFAAGVSGLVTNSTYQGSFNYENLPKNLSEKFGF